MISSLPFFLNYIIPFLGILVVIVFIHEMGHYLVARWNGVAIDAFSIGFGPEILGRTDKQGTRWSLSLIPLGGYVKFAGDMNAASIPDREYDETVSGIDADRLFVNKSVWQRMAIVFAGPAANFIFTFVILYALLVAYGQMTLSPVIDDVQVGSPAEIAGIQAGDMVLSVDGYSIKGFSDIQKFVSTSPNRDVQMDIERKGEIISVVVIPEINTMQTRFGREIKVGRIGIIRDAKADDFYLYKPNLFEAVTMTFDEMAFIIQRTFMFIGDIFIGRADVDQIAGPIGMAQVSGEVATLGFLALVNLAALLSLNIGFVNLFPVPMLDGGHLLYYIYEAIRGKPLSPRVQDIGFRIGFALVCCLMVFTLVNDII